MEHVNDEPLLELYNKDFTWRWKLLRIDDIEEEDEDEITTEQSKSSLS